MHKRVIVVQCLWISWAGLGIGATADEAVSSIDAFDVHYVIRGFGLSARVNISLSGPDEDEVYEFVNRTRAVGIARLMKPGESSETSRFKSTPDGLVPIDYMLDDSSNDPKDDTIVTFDWSTGIASSMYEGEPRELALEPGILDRMSADLAAILALRRGDEPVGHDIIHRNSIRRYNFEYSGSEEIKTKLGVYDTVKYIRQRPGSSRRTLIWYAPELCYQPVRVEQQKREKTRATMTILSLTPARDCSA